MKNERKLLILPSYCVYHKGKFYSEYPQFVKIFERQLREAIRLLNAREFDVLIISGGYTKSEVEKSEAGGMLDWAEDLNLDIKGTILLEEFARDSLENLLFSVCRFYQFFGQFPEKISCLTWKFNKKRFEIFAKKLKLPNFQVIPVGEREGQEEIAKKWTKLVKEDSLYLRQPDSKEKHQKRDPWKKSHAYWQINKDFQRFFVELELVKKTKGDLEELTSFFPWRATKNRSPFY